MIALAFLGLFLSRYLAAYEMGYIHAAWDPVFGVGTVKVLTSTVSRSMPASEAGLAALAYTLEVLSGFMGDARRWRTMPWMVLIFYVLVVPLAIVHVVLVILQPVLVGYWCAVCLAAAFTMLLMIPLAVEEVIAMFQFLKRAGPEGQPLWSAFWRGGTLKEVSTDARMPEFPAPSARAASAMIWGVSIPWTLLLSAGVGITLMTAPALLGITGPLADSEHLTGAVVLAFSVIATAEVVRAARWLNVLLGLWTVAAPWLLSGGGPIARWTAALAAVTLVLISLPRGTIREQYDGWNRAII
jgi:hypothetical protein